MSLRKVLKFLFASVLALMVVACSSGTSSGPTPPLITVTFLNPPATSLNVSTSTGLVAIVSNDSNNAGVNWKVSCGSSSCGTISPASTASGGSATYTAPSAVPSPASVTVTATSISDSSKSISASITITANAPPPPISVSFVTQPPSSLVINTTANLAASVDNDAKNGGVNWTVTCGSSQCGSFNPTVTASGSSTTYTAPSAVPTPATVTVTATSATDNTKSASATITIAATQPAIIADGTYVYHLGGQDNNLSYYVVGAFTVKNGVIAGGEQDFSDAGLGSNDQLVAANCSITATGGNIQVVLATANNQIGVNGLETLRATPVSSTRLLISEFDSFAAATGSIDLQTSTASPSGGYAFAVNGVDNSGDANQLVIGGILNFAGTSLSISNSVFDYNDAATPVLLAQSFSSGSINAPDSFGRFSISLSPSSASNIKSFILTGYLVDGHTIQLVESQGDGLNADLGGTALAQGSNAGQFSQASVANSTYVHGSQGQDTNGPVVLGGYFNFVPGGSVSGHIPFNDSVNVGGNTFSGATYSVDPTGRVVVTNVVPSNLSNINLSFILYLDGSGNGVIMGADGIQQTTGLAYHQNAPLDYEGSYALAVQGFLSGPNYVNGPVYQQPYGAVGPVTISSDNVNGFTDYTSQDPNLQPYPLTTPFDIYANTTLGGSENNSTGLFQVYGLNSLSFNQPSAFGYYPIDGNRVMAIEVDQYAMGFLMLESSSQVQSQH